MKKIFALILLCLFSSTFALEDSSQPAQIEPTLTMYSPVVENTKIYKGETPKVYNTSKEFLESEGKTCKAATDGCNRVSIQNGQLGAMTMMYCEDIYGTNGHEKWSCTDNELNVLTDDVNYFDKVLFNKLDSNTQKIKEKLKLISTEKLEKGVENAAKQIQMTKLSRIVFQMQAEKITKLYYLKFLIQDELSTRY